MKTKARAVVIGCGNPLREDDGLGWRATELLEQKLSPEYAEIIQCHQLTPELAVSFEDAAVVVFLDAAADQEPGAVSSAPVRAESSLVWPHYLSPGQLLGFKEKLGGRVPPAFLIRGGILRMGLGESLTELGEQTASRMANLAYQCIQAAFNSSDQPTSGPLI